MKKVYMLTNYCAENVYGFERTLREGNLYALVRLFGLFGIIKSFLFFCWGFIFAESVYQVFK